MELKAAKTFFVIITSIALVFLFIVLSGGQKQEKLQNSQNEGLGNLHIAREAFRVEQPKTGKAGHAAIWNGPASQNWLLITDKEKGKVIVLDAATGQRITMFREPAIGRGQLQNPTAIAVADTFTIVLDRETHKIEVFSLPGFEYMGAFTHEKINEPRAITFSKINGGYELFVSGICPDEKEESMPDKRSYYQVHHFKLKIEDDTIETTHLNTFGDNSGEGMLYKAETLLLDRPMNRLLIADQYNMKRNIKIYTPDGKFTGQVIPSKYFKYQPKGMALWSRDSDTSGYYITTDQDVMNNHFLVFDRKTLNYSGRFEGEITRNTNDITLTRQTMGQFPHGVFYTLNAENSITAIEWNTIASALDLAKSCN